MTTVLTGPVVGLETLTQADVRTIDVDAREWVVSPELVTGCAITLYRIDTGAAVAGALSGPQYSGTVAQVTVAGGALDPVDVGFYRLRFAFSTSAGQAEAADVLITAVP